jgi:hypothetical protein
MMVLVIGYGVEADLSQTTCHFSGTKFGPTVSEFDDSPQSLLCGRPPSEKEGSGALIARDIRKTKD